MKRVLSHTKTAIILLIVTVLFLGFYAYMLARPISYGMGYHNKTEYAGAVFEGTLTFYPDGKVINKNTNFQKALEDYYYYKNGYVFTLMAQTEAEYDAEVAYINENFEKAVAAPFYASRINAFRQTYIAPDGNTSIYTCKGATVFAIAGGVVSLALIALTASSFILSKKAKSEK